jgi:hypothetical protein
MEGEDGEEGTGLRSSAEVDFIMRFVFLKGLFLGYIFISISPGNVGLSFRFANGNSWCGSRLSSCSQKEEGRWVEKHVYITRKNSECVNSPLGRKEHLFILEIF